VLPPVRNNTRPYVILFTTNVEKPKWFFFTKTVREERHIHLELTQDELKWLKNNRLMIELFIKTSNYSAVVNGVYDAKVMEKLRDDTKNKTEYTSPLSAKHI